MTENEGLTPLFFKKAIYHQAESEKEGRPVYKEFDFIKILIAGDRNNVVERKVGEEDKIRFAAAWERFNRNQEEAIDGTPIEQWPVLTRSQLAEFKHYNIFTVEQLATLSDAAMQKMGPGLQEIKRKAKAYLEVLAPNAAAGNRLAALEKENETLKASNSEMEARIKAMEITLANAIKGRKNKEAA